MSDKKKHSFFEAVFRGIKFQEPEFISNWGEQNKKELLEKELLEKEKAADKLRKKIAKLDKKKDPVPDQVLNSTAFAEMLAKAVAEAIVKEGLKQEAAKNASVEQPEIVVEPNPEPNTTLHEAMKKAKAANPKKGQQDPVA